MRLRRLFRVGVPAAAAGAVLLLAISCEGGGAGATGDIGDIAQARGLSQADISAALKNIVGGEITDYTKMMAESREQSLDRMVEEAESLGANAIVGIRFTTSMIMQSASEILAYGTAVIVE